MYENGRWYTRLHEEIHSYTTHWKSTSWGFSTKTFAQTEQTKLVAFCGHVKLGLLLLDTTRYRNKLKVQSYCEQCQTTGQATCVWSRLNELEEREQLLFVVYHHRYVCPRAHRSRRVELFYKPEIESLISNIYGQFIIDVPIWSPSSPRGKPSEQTPTV